jgi:hypothetical protein
MQPPSQGEARLRPDGVAPAFSPTVRVAVNKIICDIDRLPKGHKKPAGLEQFNAGRLIE